MLRNQGHLSKLFLRLTHDNRIQMSCMVALKDCRWTVDCSGRTNVLVLPLKDFFRAAKERRNKPPPKNRRPGSDHPRTYATFRTLRLFSCVIATTDHWVTIFHARRLALQLCSEHARHCTMPSLVADTFTHCAVIFHTVLTSMDEL